MDKELEENLKELLEKSNQKDKCDICITNNTLATVLNYIENSIDKSVVEKYLVEEQEKFNVYKRESKENENLKLGMWKHLGAKNMCEKILGIERNIVTLD